MVPMEIPLRFHPRVSISSAKGWKESMDAQRYVCDLIDTMDSTWRVQEVVWRDGVTSWRDC